MAVSFNIGKRSCCRGVAAQDSQFQVSYQLVGVEALGTEYFEHLLDCLVVSEHDAMLALTQTRVQEVVVALPEVNQVGAEPHPIVRDSHRDFVTGLPQTLSSGLQVLL